ncbi:MAG: signal peptide peptidase SppA [Candidatus Omnitrophota bacterium]
MKPIVKKSTGILLLLTFFFVVIVLVGLFATVAILVMQGASPHILGGKRVALVRVEGLIYDAEEWIDQIKDYQEDGTIKAIVLRIDSPGGAVGPSQDLYQAVCDARQQHGKIVVASFASVAASGGYYIACGADHIVSAPGALTGSIGVYSKFLLAKDLMDKIGIGYETVKAGKYKDFGSMERPLSPEEREMMQGVIDDTYQQFLEAVADGRKESLSKLLREWNPSSVSGNYPFTDAVRGILGDFQEKKAQYDRTQASAPVKDATAESSDSSKTQKATLQPDEKTILALAKELAEGKIYTGRQAQQIGLVDKIGALDDAIRQAAKLAGIPGKPTVIEKKPKEFGWLDLISQGLAALTAKTNYSPLQYRFPY